MDEFAKQNKILKLSGCCKVDDVDSSGIVGLLGGQYGTLSDRIIGLYALGNSTREISDWMEENLGNRISADTISAITDRVLPELQSWRDNWAKLTAYFEYTDAIRRLIYTTNPVEGYHRQIRKVTKNKGVFTNDTALEKLVYLAYRNIRKKWTMAIRDWGLTAQQLAIKFPDRFSLFN